MMEKRATKQTNEKAKKRKTRENDWLRSFLVIVGATLIPLTTSINFISTSVLFLELGDVHGDGKNCTIPQKHSIVRAHQRKTPFSGEQGAIPESSWLLLARLARGTAEPGELENIHQFCLPERGDPPIHFPATV